MESLTRSISSSGSGDRISRDSPESKPRISSLRTSSLLSTPSSSSVVEYHKEVKVVILGSGGVGKSALVMQFLKHLFLTGHDPTIEDSFRKQICVDGQIVDLDILDTAGQEEYKSLRNNYLRQGDVFIIVYSVTTADSFANAKELIRQVIRTKELDIDPDSGESYPILLVGNKEDLPSDRRWITFSQGKRLSEEYGVGFLGTKRAIVRLQTHVSGALESSARTKKNVDEIFFEAARRGLMPNARTIGPLEIKYPGVGPARPAPKPHAKSRFCTLV